MYDVQGKYQKAIESFINAIEINGDEAIYHVKLSIALFRNGLVNKAFSEVFAARRLEPKNPDIDFQLAEFLRQIKSWNRAITNYNQILERNPDYGDAHCGLAMVYFQSGEAEEAEGAYLDCQQLSFNDNLKDEVEAAKARFEGR